MLEKPSPSSESRLCSPRNLPPSELFPELYHEVQTRLSKFRNFRDNKNFADAFPRKTTSGKSLSAEQIMQVYRNRLPFSDEELIAFVQEHFEFDPRRIPLREHIATLWDALEREARDVTPDDSYIKLPHKFIVPGGRFREMYYWDSFFTMLGLKIDKKQELIESMIENFGAMIDTFGHIPNGTRSYYLSRSQPPFFSKMISLTERADETSMETHLAWMVKEHEYWMRGASELAPSQTFEHSMRLPDGTLLNRYWDSREAPRDESYAKDVDTASGLNDSERLAVYREIRAAAESGWDFSSRWFRAGEIPPKLDNDDERRKYLKDLHVTNLAPIDLNSLMYGLERAISRKIEEIEGTKGRRRDQRELFIKLANDRKSAINKYLWNSKEGIYCDYDRDMNSGDGGLSPHATAATLFPLFEGIAEQTQAERVIKFVETSLLKKGGVVTTLLETGHQWDAPNGWAPLQWIATTALSRYGRSDIARSIRKGWLNIVREHYEDKNKLYEKYNVIDGGEGGGGEYDDQDGFGWTNAVTQVYLKIEDLDQEKDRLESLGVPDMYPHSSVRVENDISKRKKYVRSNTSKLTNERVARRGKKS